MTARPLLPAITQLSVRKQTSFSKSRLASSHQFITSELESRRGKNKQQKVVKEYEKVLQICFLSLYLNKLNFYGSLLVSFLRHEEKRLRN